MIAAMGEGEAPVLHAEAEAFATQRDYRFVKFSPATGRGICNTVSSLVELVHGARDKYSIDQEGYTQRYKRAEALQTLSPTEFSTAFHIGYYLEFDHISAMYSAHFWFTSRI